MSAESQGKSEAPTGLRARATRWMPVMLTTAAVLIVAMVGYYALQYLKGSTFREERAFRVLAEVSRQFDNMQGTLSSLLTLVPDSVIDDNCAPNKIGEYIAKLDLPGLKLEPDAPGEGKSTGGDRFDVDLDDPRRPFSIRMELATTRGCALLIRGNLRQHLPAFVNQQYFDEVLLALRNGSVLATTTNQSTDRTHIELHPDTSSQSPVADARALLLRAGDLADPTHTTNFWDTKTDKPARTYHRPYHAVAFRQEIGGSAYVVSVLPITPAYPLHVQTTGSKTLQGPQTLLYLVGLKRENLTQQAADTLGPTGTLSITTVVLLGILLWPFIGLRLMSRHGAISGFQVFAVVVSLLLIPVVLSACGVWLWTTLRLQIWADAGAENYAARIEAYLQSELAEGARLLGDYRELANAGDACTTATSAPIRWGSGKQDVWPAGIVRREDGSSCRIFLQYPFGRKTSPLMNWSPIRTAVPLNKEGISVQPRITAFGDVPTKARLDVSDRAYFKSLLAGQTWTIGKEYGETPPFVAQRLFNRSDAARVLQIAVPRTSSRVWEGALIGDTRAYGLTAGIKPPLLRFAVVDRQNGEVLFHSEDERSLAENLLVETDRNSALKQALQSGSWKGRAIALEDHFEAQYMGEPHRFYYRSMAGVPWGVAIYYPTRTISDISLDATIATLALCIGSLTLIVFLLVATAFFGSVRPDRHLLASIWPQWEWRHRYAQAAFALTLFGIVLTAALMCGLNYGHWPWVATAIVLCGALIAGAFLRIPSLAPRVTTPRAYRAFYAWSVVAFLAVTVITPTVLLAIRFHDVSMQGYLRGALGLSANDIDQRRRLMQRDLNRWVPAPKERQDRYPDGWTLAQVLPVPGFATSRPGDDTDLQWTMTAFPQMPWIESAGPAELDILRRAVWRATTETSPQQRRGRRTSITITDSGSPGTTVQRVLRTSDGRMIRVRARADDHPAHQTQRPDANEDVIYRNEWWTVWSAVTLGLCLLLIMVVLVAMTARRLFGIYLPFGVRYLDPAPQDCFPFDDLLETELRIEHARAKAADRFTDKDAADMRRVACAARHQQLWASLSADDRHLLHQLSVGQFANPENASVIEGLLYRRYIRLRPWPVINDPGFADFARTAPDLVEFRSDRTRWADEEAESTWNRIRKPLLLVGVLLAIGLMALAGTTMQIVSTALAAITALLGSVTQVTNFVRKDAGGS